MTTFTGDARQLTNWSLRYVLINGRDAASPQYANLWNALVRDAKYQDAVRGVDQALVGWKEFESWEKDLTAKVDAGVDSPWAKDKNTSAAAGRFKAVLQSALGDLEHLTNTPKPVTDALDAYVVETKRVETSLESHRAHQRSHRARQRRPDVRSRYVHDGPRREKQVRGRS
jgi:hypothetical protein